MAERQYLTQEAKEEAGKNLVNYTSEFVTSPQQARAEAMAEQQQIESAKGRGERTEIVDAMRYGAKKSLTERENVRIRTENERRQREYEAAVRRERERYEREMAEYRAQVDAYNAEVRRQNSSNSGGGGGGTRWNSVRDVVKSRKPSSNFFSKANRAIKKAFGW